MTNLIGHDPQYRRRWMVPRNIRRISPWKIAQILSLIKQISGYGRWSGNQIAQVQFCKALESAGLKKRGDQYDSHSGGPRTYLSQLECLGLIFQREGQIYFTQVGEDILNGEPPLPILQRQLLRHRYPSAYGNKVQIHPNLRVKPFLFILELLSHKRIRHLSTQEIAIALVYGHTRQCLNICVKKILRLRNGSCLNDVIDNIEEDLYTRRGQKYPDGLMDDANTVKNYLQAVCLVYVDEENGKEVVKFDEENRAAVKLAVSQADDIQPYEGYESFQRRYGARSRRGDTRQLAVQDETAADPATGIILSQFFARCGANVVTEIPDDFENMLRRDYGFSSRQIKDAVEPYLGRSLDYFESTYIELSRSGRPEDAIRFENATEAIFRDRFKFETEPTGQKRRSGVGGYADIFLVAQDNIHCAIVDAKASPRYKLPHSDYTKMIATYIPSAPELFQGRPLELEFASYVAGGYSGDVAHKLIGIERETNIPCSAITARRLLQMARADGADQISCRAALAKSRIND